MTILDWIESPLLRPVLMRMVLTALPVMLACSVLSVLIVVKRMSFVGQGVSHSAFGGIGVAAATAAVLGIPLMGAEGMVLSNALVTLFCIATAVLMGVLAERWSISTDTSIGIMLVAAMALGFVLLEVARRAAGPGYGGASLDAILFGQLLMIGTPDIAQAWVASIFVLIALWAIHRPLLFWALDERTGAAFGLRTGVMRLVLMVLIAIQTVVAMRVAGVLLAGAMLVLPGAIGMRLRRDLAGVISVACLAGIVGMSGGIATALTLNLPIGAVMVLVLVAEFVLAGLAATWMHHGRSIQSTGAIPADVGP